MSEWKGYKLGEIGLVITGKTPSAQNPEDWGNEMLFITPTDYRNYNKYANNSGRKLSSRGIDRLKNKVIPPKSLLVTCIGSDMGKVVMSNKECITNQQINSIIPNEKFDSDFTYYKLIDLYDVLKIHGGDGTAVPIVNKGDFENLTVEFSSLEEQKTIAGILSSLDDKIDLLSRQNQTLESMAKALFRQYFTDNSDENIEDVQLGEVVETMSGGTPFRKKSEYYTNGTINWIKSKDLIGTYIIETEEMITEEALNNSSAKYITINSILIAMYGSNVGEYGITSKPMTCNQAVCALVPNNTYPFTNLYLWGKAMKPEFINLACGADQQNISQIVINQQYVCGDSECVCNFHNTVVHYFDKIKSNQSQILTHTKLRDSLLPKLMLNEINI